MTGKVKLPQRISDAIRSLRNKGYSDFGIIALLSKKPFKSFREVADTPEYVESWLDGQGNSDLLLYALVNGWQVEENFVVGDWVVIIEEHESKGKVLQVKIVSDGLLNLDYGNGFQSWWPVSSLRHATPEEIKNEKERRTWAKIGREVGEFRDGDLSIGKDGFEYKTIQGMNAAYKESDLKGFYPAESFISFGGGE